jgi:hypothetical protein
MNGADQKKKNSSLKTAKLRLKYGNIYKGVDGVISFEKRLISIK